MKNTGIVRKIDELGRIVLPMEMRRTMEIKEGDPLEIFVEGDQIILKKYVSECKCQRCGKLTGSAQRIVSDRGVTLCAECVAWFANEL